jgi:hypothetical protein
MDNSTALELTLRGTYKLQGKKKVTGPRALSFETWSQQSWDLYTHGGFLTYPHHDNSGLCTYVFPRSGAKIWTFIRPNLSEFSGINDIFLEWDKLAFFEGYNSVAKMGTVLIEPGDVLQVIPLSLSTIPNIHSRVQPPGIFHMVYTPIMGNTSGGHFFTYESAHHTEVSVRFDKSLNDSGEIRGTFATNVEYEDISRPIACMVLALPYITHTRRESFFQKSKYKLYQIFDKALFKRPLAALLDMVAWRLELLKKHEVPLDAIEQENFDELTCANGHLQSNS